MSTDKKSNDQNSGYRNPSKEDEEIQRAKSKNPPPVVSAGSEALPLNTDEWNPGIKKSGEPKNPPPVSFFQRCSEGDGVGHAGILFLTTKSAWGLSVVELGVILSFAILFLSGLASFISFRLSKTERKPSRQIKKTLGAENKNAEEEIYNSLGIEASSNLVPREGRSLYCDPFPGSKEQKR